MIALVLLLAALMLALNIIILVLWFLTGQHLHPEYDADHSGDEFEVVCDPPYTAYENEDDPQTFSKTREIGTTKNTILKLENLL